jgi:membrane glycosyltransferase
MHSRHIAALRIASVLAMIGGAGAAAVLFTMLLAADGWQSLDGVLLALFVLLALWSSASCAIGLLGVGALLHRRFAAAAGRERPQPPADRKPATALVMPVYNEDAGRVFAAIRAMRDDLVTATEARFEFFVLSDSTDPAKRAAELAAWQALRSEGRPGPSVFYRLRADNAGRKAGNIADFCRRWGARYDYMVVLDADSLMTAPTLLEMVRRMERDRRIGILQVPPRLVNAHTLWGRLQQFADGFYGPMVAAGLSAWSQHDGNYWGHNAIIRVRAFAAHCGLATLPGSAPLGGEVLSHDFVEAALMRRGGWHVRIADDLEGSYEEAPPAMIESLQRDRRWCQGNLQHIALLFLRGLHPISLYHLAAGIMSYLAAPILTLFIVIGVAEGYLRLHRPIRYFVGANPQPVWPSHAEPYVTALLALTAAMLFLPKLLRLMVALGDGAERRRVGGALRLIASFFIELAASLLIAPVLMLFHSRFVVEILAGRAVGWTAQPRQAGTPAAALVRLLAAPTAVGLITMVVGWFLLGDLFWFLLPFFAGLVLAIPVALLGNSQTLADTLRRLRLLVSPDEAALR